MFQYRPAWAHSLFLLSLFLLLSPDLRADENAARPGEAPYFFVDSADPGRDQLPLKNTQVDVRISGVIADVTVTQHYRNEGSRPLNARYIFPGSTQAAVYGMNVRLGQRLITAKIREKQQARLEFHAAQREGRLAALLEQQRANVFEMNVANILPGDDVKVELRYTELLSPRDGQYQFVFPTVVGPRYTGSPEHSSRPFPAMPFLPAGKNNPQHFDLTLQLASPLAIKEVSSPSHSLDIKREHSKQLSLTLAKHQGPGNNRDFILDYRLNGDAIESGLMLYEGPEENYFLAMVAPPKQVPTAQITARDYVFVVDISGSMHGFPLDTSKALLRRLIGSLRPSDSFNVLLFAGSNSLLAPASLPATPANIERAIRLIDEQNGGGGTELLPALRRALAMPLQQDRSRSIVVVTDGYVSVEAEAFELISRNLSRANLFALGIGSSVNRELIEGMARAGQGEPFVVTSPQAADDEAERLRRLIEAPVLTHLRAEFPGLDVYDVEPQALADVFAQRPVLLFGKYRGQARGQLQLSGYSAAGHYRSSLDFGRTQAQASHSALSLLWARQRIRTLSDQQQLGGDDALAKEITRLGLKHSLLTDYTSFIAVDHVLRNSSGQADETDQPSPLPEGVSELAVGAEVPSTPEPATWALLLTAGSLLLVWLRRRAQA